MHKSKSFFSVTVAALAWIVTCSFARAADDGMQCHDLPAKKAVLEEGREFLHSHGSGTSFHSTVTPVMMRPESGWHAFPEGKDVHDDLIDQLSSCTKLYESANFRNLPAGTQAATMERLARIKIAIGLKSDGDAYFRLLNRQFRSAIGDSDFYSVAVSDVVIAAINRTLLSNADWESVEQLYQKALNLREKLKPSRRYVVDLLVLGTLSEKQNKSLDACFFFIRACKIEPESSAFLSRIILKDASTVPLIEGELNKIVETKNNRSSFVLSALLHYYITNKQDKKAIKLYEKYCLAENPFVPIPSATVASLCEFLPIDDLPSLRNYIFQLQERDPMYEQTFVNCMQRLRDRGLVNENDLVCDRILRVDSHDTIKLLGVAKWYVVSKNDARFLSVAKTIQSSSKNETDELALMYLGQLQKLSSTFEALGTRPNFTNVTSESTKLIAYREEQVRKKQCLNIAQQLDKTAFDLEKGNHLEMASKLYKESLQIKQANLSNNDPEMAMQIVDLARIAAGQHQYSESEKLYDKALSMLRKNPHTDPSTIISTLESYGMMLNDWKHENKASAIYEEAKQLHSKPRHDESEQ